MYRSEYTANSNRDNIPNDNVLFYFLNTDLKLQFLNSNYTDKLSFLNVYLIWKVSGRFYYIFMKENFIF
jgi:hypothetical protein